MGGFRRYLAIQTVLPEAWENDRAFIRSLELLGRAGFDGVELNILDPAKEDPLRLAAFLGRFGLSFSMYATGLAARTAGLSLSSTDEQRRRRSVAWTREALAFSSAIGGGVIAGFLKGAAGEGSEAHRGRLRASLAELAPEAARLKAPLLVEAINHNESPLGHTIAEVRGLLGTLAGPFMQVLPDTWHMSIEEPPVEESLPANLAGVSSVHLSDDNRLLPGFGGLDFPKILDALETAGYQGKLAIEGNVRTSFDEDAARSADYLRAFIGAR